MQNYVLAFSFIKESCLKDIFALWREISKSEEIENALKECMEWKK